MPEQRVGQNKKAVYDWLKGDLGLPAESGYNHMLQDGFWNKLVYQYSSHRFRPLKRSGSVTAFAKQRTTRHRCGGFEDHKIYLLLESLLATGKILTIGSTSLLEESV